MSESGLHPHAGKRAPGMGAREILAAVWAQMPARLRLPTQFLGRHYAGCGATIGAMPRCDFKCHGCYLTHDANSARPAPLADIEDQLDQIRAWLGPGGNVQLTDGEITLRKEAELLAIITYARRIGLVPMLMTHGETFRRDPGLLERLVRGGLTEICFHVDTTMRGRRDHYDQAQAERELDGLRATFADLIRATRRRTGRHVQAASTVTVSRANLDQVPDIVRWFLANADAFKMVSFQPVAAVGRTAASLTGVTAGELWARIAQGCGDPEVARGFGYLGDPDCSRFVQGLVSARTRKFVPLYDGNSARDMRLLAELLERFGGNGMRAGNWRQSLRAGRRTIAAHGLFLLRNIPLALARRLWALRTLRPRYLCIVSHHFMSAAELETGRGRERLANCVFRVPVAGRLEPMCAINALGIREQVYTRGRGVSEPVATSPPPRTGAPSVRRRHAASPDTERAVGW